MSDKRARGRRSARAYGIAGRMAGWECARVFVEWRQARGAGQNGA